MYRKRQYQKSTASHGPVTLIFSERLFYLDTNQESPILEQSERKVSFWNTLGVCHNSNNNNYTFTPFAIGEEGFEILPVLKL